MDYEQLIPAIRAIINDDEFSDRAQDEAIQAILRRAVYEEKQLIKTAIISDINKCDYFDKRDARIIVSNNLQ